LRHQSSSSIGSSQEFIAPAARRRGTSSRQLPIDNSLVSEQFVRSNTRPAPHPDTLRARLPPTRTGIHKGVRFGATQRSRRPGRNRSCTCRPAGTPDLRFGRMRSPAEARIRTAAGERIVARLSENSRGPTTSCTSMTRSRFCAGPFRSRDRFGRLPRSWEVPPKRRCHFRTSARNSPTASRQRDRATRGRGRMKAIVRTAAAGRSRLGNAQVASPTLAAQSAPLLTRDSASPARRRQIGPRCRFS
jgi:hypothetical protein